MPKSRVRKRTVYTPPPPKTARRKVSAPWVGPAIVASDLVLMRAGGSSVAECAALERPMILVPYPHAGDHQRFNAAPYVDAGAARLIPDAECDPERARGAEPAGRQYSRTRL